MTVTNNKVVSIHYRATDNDDNIVDDNEEFAPLEYLHGYNNILAGLEKALEGLEVGQETQVTLAPADAYGEYDAGKLTEVNRAVFSADADELQPGVIVESSDGMELLVKDVNETTITLDGNHPLAGATLHFTIKIVFIREATADELQHKHPISQQNESCEPGCCC
ncbi:FKBP-type peptidyl-prolyl cis-trans isomerase [Flavobacterium sp. ZB4P13]|uniref:FKBP-type peptidyl-prolyl cis-trans isomerase n=1 Tax=Flavobacterium sp. ZB4P13 TaxID=3401728 RepID=UPI003AAD0AB1